MAGAAAVLAVALVAVLVARSGGDDAPPRYRPADRAFSVVLPAGWRAADAEELARTPSAPAAVLRRADRRGVVVIRKRPALARSSRSLTRDLTAHLRRRVKGLEPVGARTVPLASGPAYVYTFARPSAGTVQSIAVAPRRGGTYTIDAVASAGGRDAAAQIGTIVRSFDTPDPVPAS
ncbi:MAG TPA: hypothetical protein VHF51_07880 [Solirubrobacteraceae bacterium]|nr:hypothetical protein [Solirubrobacteraceae bacterium]